MMGTYVLLLKMDQDEEIQIGNLGKFNFKKGFYAYVGSGLENFGRLERHINIAKGVWPFRHWHIDYFLPCTKLDYAFAIPIECTMKCDLAIALEKDIKIIPVFGTDCYYDAHLFYSEKDMREKINDICKKFGKIFKLDFNIKEKSNDRKKEIKDLELQFDKELSLEREYASKIICGPIRDNSFRYKILNVYKYKCAICGLQMNMVEACHIIPVEADGTDEIINGIALCHNHHKAFDSGLIWINKDYDIELNYPKINDMKCDNNIGGLDNFIKISRIGERIFLPDNYKFFPAPDYLSKKINS